jgi:hypothetical protein
MKFCAGKKTYGTRCSIPVGEGEFCYFHDPTKAKKRAKARRLGGQRQRVESTSEWPSTLRNPQDAICLLETTAKELQKHENSISRNRCLIDCVRAVLEVFKVGELEGRVAALEKFMEAKNEHS